MFVLDNQYVDNYFIDWLLDVITMQCQAAIQPRKLEKLSKHIVANNILNLTQSQQANFNLYREMLKVSRSLRWRKVKDYYIIYVPHNVFVSGTNIPLSRLSRFVSYGDLNVKGYPILSEIIQGVIANIAKYINQYEKLFYGGV